MFVTVASVTCRKWHLSPLEHPLAELKSLQIGCVARCCRCLDNARCKFFVSIFSASSSVGVSRKFACEYVHWSPLVHVPIVFHKQSSRPFLSLRFLTSSKILLVSVIGIGVVSFNLPRFSASLVLTLPLFSFGSRLCALLRRSPLPPPFLPFDLPPLPLPSPVAPV